MKHAALIFLLAVIAGTAAGVARADYLSGDPRKCPAVSTPQATPDKPAGCAYSAAKVTLLKYMRTHGHPTWSNPMTCAQVSSASLLKWRCSFGTGSAVVWFRPLSTGWKRVVTVTMNP